MAPTHRWMISAAALSLVAGTLGLQETVSLRIPERDEPQMVLGGIATPGSFGSRDNSVAAQPLTSDQSDKAWFSRTRALTTDSLGITTFGVRQRSPRRHRERRADDRCRAVGLPPSDVRAPVRRLTA